MLTNATSIAVNVCNNSDADICQQPVRVGIALPPGHAFHTRGLELTACEWIDPVHQISVLNRWHDESLRWILVECLVSLKARTSAELHLVKREKPEGGGYLAGPSVSLQSGKGLLATVSTRGLSASPGIAVQDSPAELVLDTGIARFTFARDTRSVFPLATVNGRTVWSSNEVSAVLTDAVESPLPPVVQSVRIMQGSGPHRTSIAVKAYYRLISSQHVLNVTFCFHFYANSANACLETTLHNPAAAKHRGGLWDLGDEGSAVFSGFSLVFSIPQAAKSRLRAESDQPWISLRSESLSLYQASSGGDAWDSPGHMDASGQVSSDFQGYRVSESERPLCEGLRATPTALVADSELVWQLRPLCFWQNCPKALTLAPGSLELELFPQQSSSNYELQGGEQKTHRIAFYFGSNDSALDWLSVPLEVSVPREVYALAGVFPNLDEASIDVNYDVLVETGLDDEQGFVAKRELVDEYGWRHFGDLYADHETWNRKHNGILISHYNNQYDPIYGFARQYASTGDSRWFELMRDLAEHVMDIDVYRTEHDRADYCGGLFWHTDHYVSAYTSTHRTFSRQQLLAKSQHVGGGGPGGEHCYTTGLSYYHFLTGDPRAKDTVLLLTKWITRFYEGTSTLFEQLIVLLKRDVPDLVAILRGHYRFRYRYPLDRGVGNYVNALLDCLELTGRADYLLRAENVILNTIGPTDDISQRHFDDIEGSWFYTVFLQALVRYLDVKWQRGQLDDAFSQAREALLHYAEWMVINEKPYLMHSDKLEFPNDTWVAQDIRKANVLFAAHIYRLDDSVDYLAGAEFFREYVVETLKNSSERHYTRILAILMQNHGPSSLMASQSALSDELRAPKNRLRNAGLNGGRLTVQDVFARTARAITRAIFRMSPTREWRWLRRRIFH